MANITTRTGKGSALTHSELDNNFSNLNTDKAELSGADFTGNVSVDGNVSVTGTVDGRDVAADGTKLDGVETGADVTDTANVVGSLTAGTNITIAANGTITATNTNTQLTNEEVQDIVGAMLSGNTETGITVSYQDADGTIDFVVDTQTDENFTTALKNKLDAIESGATADQTAAEIRALVESASNSNVFTDADHTKLDGIEASADVTDTTNVVASLTAGTNITIAADGTISASDSDTVLTSEQVQDIVGAMVSGNTETGITVTYQDADGTIDFVVASQTDENFTTTLKNKLDAIEASADVTDTTNVVASLTAGTNVTIDANGTISSTDTNTQLTAEQVQDIVGAMFSGNTETGIAVTYEDTDGTVDFVVTTQSDENFTAALKSKLDGIEASADVTDTANVVASLTAGSNITIAADGTIASTSADTYELDISGDTGTGTITDAETLVVFGGSGIGTSVTNNTLAISADTATATTKGIASFDSGDFNISGGSVSLASSGGAVDSVNTQTGVVVLDADDISDTSTTNKYTTASDISKLAGIEAAADVTDATNVTAAGALMDSEVTNLAQVKAFDSADYATAAQGTNADNALPKSGGAMTGAITTNSTFDGRDVSADGTKLDGIEASATADQTAAEIRALVESASDSNVFTDADHTKLNAIEASATADQTDAEIRAAVEAATDSNVFTDADHTKLDGLSSSEGYLNVKDFGAKGDGSTDDTTAIQDAINYASHTSVNDGGGKNQQTIFFPDGHYKYSVLRTYYDGTDNTGFNSNIADGRMVFRGTGRMAISDLVNYDGSATGNNSAGTRFNGAVLRSTGAGIIVDPTNRQGGSANARNFVAKDITFVANNTGQIIEAKSCPGITFDHCSFRQLGTGGGIVVRNCWFFTFNQSFMVGEGSGDGISSEFLDERDASGNRINESGDFAGLWTVTNSLIESFDTGIHWTGGGVVNFAVKDSAIQDSDSYGILADSKTDVNGAALPSQIQQMTLDNVYFENIEYTGTSFIKSVGGAIGSLYMQSCFMLAGGNSSGLATAKLTGPHIDLGLPSSVDINNTRVFRPPTDFLHINAVAAGQKTVGSVSNTSFVHDATDFSNYTLPIYLVTKGSSGVLPALENNIVSGSPGIHEVHKNYAVYDSADEKTPNGLDILTGTTVSSRLSVGDTNTRNVGLTTYLGKGEETYTEYVTTTSGARVFLSNDGDTPEGRLLVVKNRSDSTESISFRNQPAFKVAAAVSLEPGSTAFLIFTQDTQQFTGTGNQSYTYSFDSPSDQDLLAVYINGTKEPFASSTASDPTGAATYTVNLTNKTITFNSGAQPASGDRVVIAQYSYKLIGLFSESAGSAGDITGVTAGDGLSGGGASGSVSVAVDGTVARTTGDTFTGSVTFDNTVRLTTTTDAELTSTGHALQIGSSSGVNIAADNNEIMARNNGASSLLILNKNGGAVSVNNVDITGVKINQWNTAYGWGDHSTAGYTSNVGDITNVTAGTGLTGGGASGSVTLNVNTGAVANGAATIPTGDHVHDFVVAQGYTSNTGDITAVTAGTSLSGGGTSGGVTLNVATPTDAPSSWVDVVAWNSALVKDAAVEIHGSGYLRAYYLNMTHGVTTRNSESVFFSSTDDYIRKNNATGFRTSLNVPTRTGGDASGTWGINITGSAGTLDGIDSSQFLRSDVSDSVAAGRVTSFNSYSAINTTTGNQSSLEVKQASAGNDAFMTFHIGGQYATYFGLDATTNDLAVGGWSKGATNYKVWHAGNDGAGSGLDADLLDGINSSQFLRSDTADTMTGELTMSGSSPQIKFNDTSSGADDFWLHTNSNNFYVLTDRDDNGAWDGSNPLLLENSSSKAYAYGHRVLTVADEGSGNGLDADTVDGINSSQFLRSDTGDTMSGDLTINGRLDIGNGSGADHEIRIYKADNNNSDHIQFYNGTTRMGEIGCQDTTWLRINHVTPKNIYTPRYIRADGGFFVDGQSKGINGSGNFVNGTIAGASDANVSNWNTAHSWGNHASAGYASTSFSSNLDMNNNDIVGVNALFHEGDSNTYMHFPSSDTWAVRTGGTEAMRINSSHEVLFHTTSNDPVGANDSGASILPQGRIKLHCNENADPLVIGTRQASRGVSFWYHNGSSASKRGNILITSGGVSYNNLSDERAKENIVDSPSASNDIDAIQVRSFNYKGDDTHIKYGVIAQELNTVAPEVVHIPDDPEEMAGVDYSKLVPMLVKEIQSLRTRVAQLEGKI